MFNYTVSLMRSVETTSSTPQNTELSLTISGYLSNLFFSNLILKMTIRLGDLSTNELIYYFLLIVSRIVLQSKAKRHTITS